LLGKINVGKTALLEALRIYFQQGNLTLLQNIFQARDESPRYIRETPRFIREEDFSESISNLFPNRRFVSYSKVTVGKVGNDEEKVSIQILPGKEIYPTENRQSLFRDLDILHLAVFVGINTLYSIPITSDINRTRLLSRTLTNSINLQFVKANGLDPVQARLSVWVSSSMPIRI
jgi:hypothetical protein